MDPFRYSISLRIATQSLDPKKICAEIGLKPRILHTMGEPRTTPNGSPLAGINEYSFCVFELDQNTGEKLSEMMDRMCNSLLPYQDLFRNIRDTGGRVEFYIGWFSVGNTRDAISCDLFRKLGQLGIELSFDVYGESDPTLMGGER